MRNYVLLFVLLGLVLMSCDKDSQPSSLPLDPTVGDICHPDVPSFCAKIELRTVSTPDDTGWVNAVYKINYESELNCLVHAKDEKVVDIPPRNDGQALMIRLTLSDLIWNWIVREKIPTFIGSNSMIYGIDDTVGLWKASILFEVRYCKVATMEKKAVNIVGM